MDPFQNRPAGLTPQEKVEREDRDMAADAHHLACIDQALRHAPAPGQAAPVPVDPAELRERCGNGLEAAEKALTYRMAADRVAGQPLDLVLHGAHREVRLALIWLGLAA